MVINRKMLQILPMLLIAAMGCDPQLPSVPSTIREKANGASDDVAVSLSSEPESLKKVLTRKTWVLTTGSGAFAECWVFRFDSDGTYLFTIVSDFSHTPIQGRWSLEVDDAGANALRLSDLEKGKYYIIDQLTYPRYDPVVDSITFPTAPAGEGVALIGRVDFDWDARQGG
jgi:hypothetical protein